MGNDYILLNPRRKKAELIHYQKSCRQNHYTAKPS